MRPPHHILDRNRVHRLAAEHLQEHLKFKDYKRRCSAQVLWSLLLAAAARITSLSDACQRLRDVPSDETARKALLATLPDYAALQRQLNAALAGHLPKALRTHLQRLAIDLTLIPYHGRAYRDPEEIYRGQAKSGTSHFHAYATAYVLRKGQRYTVALTGVTKGESLKEVVRRVGVHRCSCRFCSDLCARAGALANGRPLVLQVMSPGFFPLRAAWSTALVVDVVAVRLLSGLPGPCEPCVRAGQRHLR